MVPPLHFINSAATIQLVEQYVEDVVTPSKGNKELTQTDIPTPEPICKSPQQS